MILLRKSTAMIFLLLFTASIAAIGIYGYQALDGGSQIENKALAERLLYLSIIGVTLVVAAFLGTVGRTLSLYRELDKMIELNKRGDFSPELSMKKLGPIGERITLLYFTLNSLNEKKTLKISALSGLADFLIENVETPLFVTDVQGRMVYIGREFTALTERNRSELLNQNALGLFPDLPYRDLILELDKRKSAIEVVAGEDPLTLMGIQNRMKELSYVIWIFAKGIHLPNGSSHMPPTQGKQNRIRRLFGRRK